MLSGLRKRQVLAASMARGDPTHPPVSGPLCRGPSTSAATSAFHRRGPAKATLNAASKAPSQHERAAGRLDRDSLHIPPTHR